VISTVRDNQKKSLAFKDNAPEAVSEYGQEVLDAVRAAVRAGLTEFTTPTIADDDRRINWKVRKFIHLRGDKPVCHLVAQNAENEHFEVLCHEVDLKLPEAKPEPAKS
jgi:hypothetical protein